MLLGSVSNSHVPSPYKAMEHNGLKIMILLRLSPLIPNHTLDYVSGVSSISLRDYTIALIGILPATIALCYTGATASSVAEGTESATKANTIMLVAGLIFAFAGALLASYYAKQELDKIIQDESPLDDDSTNNRPSVVGHDNNRISYNNDQDVVTQGDGIIRVLSGSHLATTANKLDCALV